MRELLLVLRIFQIASSVTALIIFLLYLYFSKSVADEDVTIFGALKKHIGEITQKRIQSRNNLFKGFFEGSLVENISNQETEENEEEEDREEEDERSKIIKDHIEVRKRGSVYFLVIKY